jgi:hypothetical protein
VTLDYATTNFNYLETLPDGSAFDTEKGWVSPGISVTGSLMRDLFGVCNLYISGRFTYVDGHTNYWSPPLVNTDGAKVYDEDFRIGKGFDLSNNMMLTPYIGAGAHLWSRNLPGPGGYHEDYSNGYWGGGLLFQVAPVSRLVLSANGLVGSTFDASMNTTLIPGGGAIIPQTYKLGSSVIFMAGVSADYAITQQWHVNVEADYVNFKYGASPVSTIDGSNEPDSRTSNWTLRAGLGYAY